MQPGNSPGDRPFTVVLADAQNLVREGIRQLLENDDACRVVGEAGNGEEALRLVMQLRPDLLLLELWLTGMTGLQVLRELSRAGDSCRRIVLTGNMPAAEVDAAFVFGAHGVVFKDADRATLMAAVDAVMVGARWFGAGPLAEGRLPVQARRRRRPFGFSDRELEVLRAACCGYSNKEIAAALAISDQTVKHHLTKIFAKAGVSHRNELLQMAIATGLATIDPALARTRSRTPR